MNALRRPYIILSAAMTIDGKIASKVGDPELSDEEDWKEVHKLRSQVDAIMVGKGTILKDDPKLHIKYYDHDGYYRIVADSKLSIPLNAKVIDFQPRLYPTIIITTKEAPPEKIKLFSDKKVKIIHAGTEGEVDILEALTGLNKLGINRILLEGGGTLNWSFIKEDLIDEMRLTLAPWMIGGKHATSLVEGAGFEKMSQAPRFTLIKLEDRNNYVLLHYKRIRK